MALAVVQYTTHLLPLDPVTYYVDFVPIHFNIWAVVGLNVAVFLICMLVLVLPAWVVGRKITPVSAVRFE